MSIIESFQLAVPQADLDDLHRRLDHARWPEKEPVDDWSQGAPLAKLRALCEYWRNGYDWRRCEARLNALGQFRAEIDGLQIHFMHVRSPHPDALPLILTHGWPGSIIEFLKVVGPLSNPTAHGGKAEDAFHLIVPSLPGYGFSGKPAETGWGVMRIAQAWATLMERLGYDRYVAQGGDWGSTVTTKLGALAPAGLAAIHLNMVVAFPDPADQSEWTEGEKACWESFINFKKQETGYSSEQMTRPQTIGYSLVDSPVGQAAWIYEKFRAWTDCGGDPENVLSPDEMLDNISLYWLTGSGASSARLYWESMADGFVPTQVLVPTGCSIFPKEMARASRRWAERNYRNIVHWNELDRGGHFAAFEQPDLFTSEVRACFRPFQQAR
ncbi:epoxide hydrolase family protein [Rhizorhabdus argentea]|uniref:epoxide hydrolase family protein n=1 Tax=Rhizorhabdus argentea TaxID=1387174 RepID=UPI0030EC0F31